MTEKVTYGSMGGGWRPGMAVRVRHRQPKGTANGWAGLQPRRQPSTLQQSAAGQHHRLPGSHQLLQGLEKGGGWVDDPASQTRTEIRAVAGP